MTTDICTLFLENYLSGRLLMLLLWYTCRSCSTSDEEPVSLIHEIASSLKPKKALLPIQLKADNYNMLIEVTNIVLVS